jgi:hypothetical protein
VLRFRRPANPVQFLRDVGTGVTIMIHILQCRINKTMFPVKRVICDRALFSDLQTRVCRQWPTHSPTQSEQWAPPTETRRPEHGNQHSSQYRVVGRHIRTPHAPLEARCSCRKTVFTLMKLTRRHAPSLHLQRSAVRSLTKISRITKLLSSRRDD